MTMLNGAAAHRWLTHYPPGVPTAISSSRHETLVDLVRTAGKKFADRAAFESFGKAITYGDLLRQAEAFAAWLQARGLRQGDRVAVMMPNVLANPVAIIGALLGGYTVVNVNPLYTPRELTHQLNDSGARAIVVLENFAHVVEESLPNVRLEHVLVATAGDLMGLKGLVVNLVARHVKKVVKPWSIPSATRFSAALAEGARATSSPVSVTPDDIAFLQYTGGTTGVAKGAVLRHRNIIANVDQCDVWFSPLVQAKGADGHVMIAALPLYHIFALTCCCMYMLRLGATVRLIANPRDIPGFIKTLAGSRFTMMCGVNTLYNALLNHPSFETINFKDLVFAVAGGMAMQSPVATRWKQRTGVAVLEGYGLTETSPVVCANPYTLADFSGTIGFPVPSTEVVIRDDLNRDVAPGEAGELCVRGPQVMSEYWQRPDETAKAMTSDGFFRTGDIAVMLPDGQFKIVDRMKDMVLVSGFNVYPNEVEEVLVSHEAVLEAAVIGVPDANSGEAVTAFVVPKDPTLTEEALKAHARQNLTPYKVPKHIIFRESLPKTNVGKVLRRALRDEMVKGSVSA